MSKMSSIYFIGFELPSGFAEADTSEQERILENFLADYSDIVNPCKVYSAQTINSFLQEHGLQDREKEFTVWDYTVWPLGVKSNDFAITIDVKNNTITNCGIVAWENA